MTVVCIQLLGAHSVVIVKAYTLKLPMKNFNKTCCPAALAALGDRSVNRNRS